MVIGTECTCSCLSNYHTITTTTALTSNCVHILTLGEINVLCLLVENYIIKRGVTDTIQQDWGHECMGIPKLQVTSLREKMRGGGLLPLDGEEAKMGYRGQN